MFGEIVSFVGSSGSPIEVELFVCNAMFEPMITHVKGFGSFHAHLSIEDVVSSRVVSLKRGTGERLGMTHLFEGSDKGDGFLGIEEEATSFGFGGGGGNTTDSLAEYVNRAIGGRVGGKFGAVVGEVKKSGATTARIW